jgi:hypothetical protein
MVYIWQLPKEVQKEIRRKAKLAWQNSSIEVNSANYAGKGNVALSYGGWVNKYKKEYLNGKLAGINRK